MNKYIKPTIYPLSIFVSIVDENTPKFFEEYDLDINEFPLEEDEEAKTYFKGNYIMVISKTSDIALLVHEMFHVVEYVFNYIGLIHSVESSEAWAYYLSYLIKEINEC